jgi:hypothetical protein
MSFLESVVQKTRRLERVLEEKYQAHGKGLHEKATSVEHKIDSNTLKQIRFIASVRNKLMHEDGYRFDGSESEFLRKCDEAIEHLTNQQRQSKTHTGAPSTPRAGKAVQRNDPEPARSTHRTSSTVFQRNDQATPSTSSYSSSASVSRSYSSSNDSNSRLEEVFKHTFQALLIGVFLYPIIGLGGCLTRLAVGGSPPNPMLQTQAHDTWLHSPLKAWTTEAVIIPLLVVAATFFVNLIKIRRVNPVLTVFLFLVGAAATIYVGSGLTMLSKRNPATPGVTKSRQAGPVGTLREVNTMNLNMRSGPGPKFPLIATFTKKSKIVSYGETKIVDGELWTQASTPDGGTRGWVVRKFLSP